MVKIFISPYCASCRKARKFLQEMEVPHEVINIFSTKLTKEDLLQILELSDVGTDDLISTRSKIYREGDIDIESMTLDELLDFILKNPTVMKRPIIIDDRKLAVGYDPDEITAFLPRATKELLERCGNCHMLADCNMVETLKRCQQQLAKEQAEKKGNEEKNLG